MGLRNDATLVVPEKVDSDSDDRRLRLGLRGSQRWLESQSRPTVVRFFLSPAKNEPQENSQEFSQVKAAAHQQCVYAVAVFALQVVAFHPVVLFQVANHWLDGRAPAQ